MPGDQEEKIIQSWQVNAQSWINTLKNNEIESRRLVTNQKIVDTILSLSPRSVLDIGSGEGWLTHELLNKGINCIGFDAIPDLVQAANKVSPGKFYLASYDNFRERLPNAKYDLAVCNFSLFGKESVEQLLTSLPSIINPHGHLVIQTLNPRQYSQELGYTEGWYPGSWAGFNKSFKQPAPWYFRDMESWMSLFTDKGYQLVEFHEPAHPGTGNLLSLIIVCQVQC